MSQTPPVSTNTDKVLQGTRIVSLALNLPGPAALMRCRQMGAQCIKLEPPAHPKAPSGAPGDPMGIYNRGVYDLLHQGVRVATADLKTPDGQKRLEDELKKAHVLLTSSRPSALSKLGLDWKALHKRFPQLYHVSIVGAAGAASEIPGHDLTYLAENDLVMGLNLPATLYADMGGSLMASEAILKARLMQLRGKKGRLFEVALSTAAGYLALPRQWKMTTQDALLGGAHAGYRMYPCRDGRVAVAALEPHFAASLAKVAGLKGNDVMTMFMPDTKEKVASFFAALTCAELNALARANDLPLHTLAD